MKAKALFHLGILFLSLGTFLLPWTANAQGSIVFLGGVDLNGYCRAIGGSMISLQGPNAYSWHCLNQFGQDFAAVSVLDACRFTYHDSNAVDRLGNYNDPGSWGCFTHARQLGGVDLDGYCRSLGHLRVQLDGPTAYDWHCITTIGQRVAISATGACQWSWRQPGALDRLADFNNPYSWQCWGPL